MSLPPSDSVEQPGHLAQVLVFEADRDGVPNPQQVALGPQQVRTHDRRPAEDGRLDVQDQVAFVFGQRPRRGLGHVPHPLQPGELTAEH
jgi:hypothetical protein